MIKSNTFCPLLSMQQKRSFHPSYCGTGDAPHPSRFDLLGLGLLEGLIRLISFVWSVARCQRLVPERP